ncbi:MAG: hypothetical protein MHMPM18_000293 [Marteilia pararefringens]
MSSNVQNATGLSQLTNIDSFLSGKYGIWATSSTLLVLISLNFVAALVYYLVDSTRCGTTKCWRKFRGNYMVMGAIFIMEVTILVMVAKRGVSSFNFIFNFTRTSNYMRLVSFIQNLLSSSVQDIFLEVASIMPNSFVRYFDYVDIEIINLIIEIVFDLFDTTDGLGNGERNFTTFFSLPGDKTILDFFTAINKSWNTNPSKKYNLDKVHVDELLFSYSFTDTLNFILNFGIFYLSNLNWTFMIMIAVLIGSLVALTILTFGFFATHVLSDVKYGAYVVSVSVMLGILTVIILIITSLIDNIERNFGQDFDLVAVLMKSLEDYDRNMSHGDASQPYDYRNSRYLIKLLLKMCKDPDRTLLNKLSGLELMVTDVSKPIYLNLICTKLGAVLERKGLWDDLDSDRNEMIYRKMEEFIYHLLDIIYGWNYVSIGSNHYQMFDLKYILSDFLFV